LKEKAERQQREKQRERDEGELAIQEGFKVACVWPPISEATKPERQQQEREQQRRLCQDLKAQGAHDDHARMQLNQATKAQQKHLDLQILAQQEEEDKHKKLRKRQEY